MKWMNKKTHSPRERGRETASKQEMATNETVREQTQQQKKNGRAV